MKKTLIIAIAFTALIMGCTKKDVTNPNPTTTSKDSTVVFVRAYNPNVKDTYTGQVAAFSVEYLNGSVPYRFYSNPKNPNYIYYKNGAIDHIITIHDTLTNNLKGKMSTVFLYGTNGKCNKILHKYAPYNLNNNSPFFTDLTDGSVSSKRDSLVYTPTNQISAIYAIGDPNNPFAASTTYDYYVKFYYPNATDSVVNKIEYYGIDYQTYTFKLVETLDITTTNINNPAFTNFWYLPLFYWEVNVTVQELPIPYLLYNPTSHTSVFLSLVSKLVKKYTVNGNGTYSGENFYYPNSDSTYIGVDMGPNFPQYYLNFYRAAFNLKKVKL